MLRWQDHFRPLLEAADGLETGALTRFLDTNTFYRAPKATRRRRRSPGRSTRATRRRSRARASRPCPRRIALARGTGVSPKAMAEGVLAACACGARGGARRPGRAVPRARRGGGRRPISRRRSRRSRAGRSSRSGSRSRTQAALLEQGAADLPVDGIGIDFYATHLDDVPAGFDKLLLAGVVDVRSSLPEEPAEIAAFAARLAERGVERIALVPNGDLQYVSEPIAREKLARLGQAKTATTEAAHERRRQVPDPRDRLAREAAVARQDARRAASSTRATSSTPAAGARRSASRATRSWSSRSQRGGADPDEVARWSSRYCVRMQEAAGLDVIWDGEQHPQRDVCLGDRARERLRAARHRAELRQQVLLEVGRGRPGLAARAVPQRRVLVPAVGREGEAEDPDHRRLHARGLVVRRAPHARGRAASAPATGARRRSRPAAS